MSVHTARYNGQRARNYTAFVKFIVFLISGDT